MNHLGDFPVSGKVFLLWNTNDQTGASITRATDGTLKIYKGNLTAATWITERSSLAGVTQTEDFDGATGVHAAAIDLSDNTDAGFYAAGNEYQIVMTGMVIDGKTVNARIGAFSIERAGGILELLKSGTFGLSVLKTETASIQSDTNDIQSRLPAALTANGNMKSSLMEILTTALTETAGLLAAAFKKFFNVATPTGTVNSLPDAVPGAAGGGFIAGANAASSITTALTANIIGNITGNLSGSVGSVTAGVTLAGSAVQAIWDALTSALTTVGSIGKLLVDRIDAAITSRMATYTQPAGFLAATFPSDPADQSLVIAATDAIIAKLPAALVGGRMDSSVGAVAAGAITAAAIATDAIDADALAADAVTEMQVGLATAAAVVTAQADLDNIQSRLPAALTGAGNIKADALAVDGSTTAATNLKSSATVIYVGSVTGAVTTTTLIDAGLTQADADHWKGRIIIFLTGALKYQATDVTAFDPATDKLTFTALTQAPAGGDQFVIV